MHDACGCGHAHESTESNQATVQMEAQEAPHTDHHAMDSGCGNSADCSMDGMESEMGCGEGCGCGSSAQPLTPEVAAMRGFLSGVYATTLGRADLEAYLAAMGSQEGSEFAPAAQFLAERLKSVPVAQGEEGVPPAWDLLAAMSGSEGGSESGAADEPAGPSA